MVYSYLIVEFLGDLSVREISETWLFKSSDGHLKTRWPPYLTDRDNNKAILNHTAPTDEWRVYNVRQLGGKYDDYIVARNKAKAAEKHSDINTAEEDESGRTKRRRIRSNPSAYNHHSEDSSCGEEANGTSILPSLPKPPSFPSTTDPTDSYMPVRRSPRKHKSKRTDSTMDDNSLDLGDYTFHSRPTVSQVDISSNDLNMQQSTPSTYTDISNSTPLCNRRIFPSPCISEQTPTTSNARSPPLTPAITRPVTSRRSQCLSCKDHDKNYNQILRKLAEIKATQQHQQETLDMLLNQHEGQRLPINLDRLHIQSMEDDCTADLPVKSAEELVSLEKKLTEEPNFKSNVTRQLSLIGGATPYDAVKRMLRKLMTDAVGSQYSFLGFKKKMRFDKLVVKDVLFNAVRLNFLTKNTTEKEMELAVKKWLQHAKTRAQNAL